MEHTAFIPSVKKTTVMETLFNDWRKVDLDEKEFKKYLDYSISNLNPIEGIWTNIDNNEYRIGIIKDEANDYWKTCLDYENSIFKFKIILMS